VTQELKCQATSKDRCLPNPGAQTFVLTVGLCPQKQAIPERDRVGICGSRSSPGSSSCTPPSVLSESEIARWSNSICSAACFWVIWH
jgi:hypothetical protein